jgi:type II secretory pathway component PulJ
MSLSRRPVRRLRRSGVSLVEMLVVITVLTAVLGSVAVTLHVLWRLEAGRRNAAAAAEALSRLSAQLRADAHQAIAIEPHQADDNLPAGLALMLPDQTRVVYQPKENLVYRTSMSGEATSHRDVFRLAPGLRAAARVAGEEERPVAELEVTRQSDAPEPERAAYPWVRIVAAVNSHEGVESE